MHDRVIDDAHVALIAACRAMMQSTTVWGYWHNKLSNSSENHNDLIKHSAISALVDLISMDLGDDMQCQRFACLAIGNFASKIENHDIIFRSDALQPLIQCVKAQDLETRFHAAFALGKLAQVAHNHARIGNAGAITPLIELMYSEDNRKMPSNLYNEKAGQS